MQTNTINIFTVFILLFPLITYANTKFVTTEKDGHLEFLAIGRPAMIRIKGEANGPAGNMEVNDGKAHGKFTIKLDSLSTGIEMRDQHMKEKYLETKKNPTAELSIDAFPVKDLERTFQSNFVGTLSVHNVIKNVAGQISYEANGPTKHVSAELKIRLSDFGIEIPSYAGMTVADEVQVKVNFDLKPESL